MVRHWPSNPVMRQAARSSSQTDAGWTHTGKKVTGSRTGSAWKLVVWRASPDSLAAVGVGPLPVSDVSGGLTTLAGDALPPRRMTEGSQ